MRLPPICHHRATSYWLHLLSVVYGYGMDPLHLQSTIQLSSGQSMPRLGLGVFRSGSGKGTQDAVRWALDEGYRHIDTAHIYHNERDVGIALRESGIAREEVYITTKLWNDDQGYDQALRAFERSLEQLDLSYVDLYLMHWPVPERRRDSWRAMETLLADGRCRAIGVSNFMVDHIDSLLEYAEVLPAVNQIELSPYLQQVDVVARCQELNICVEAYSPLTKGRRLDDPRLMAVATDVGRSAAQVLIRWSLQKGYVVIPKSANQKRIRENAQVFDFALNEDQMAILDSLEENLHTAWDPSNPP